MDVRTTQSSYSPEEVTYKVKLLGAVYVNDGYQTYVFENLDYTDDSLKYIMCVKLPNWNIHIPEFGTVGFVQVLYVLAGITQWYNGKEMVPYRYTNVYMTNFIPEKTIQTDSIFDYLDN